MKTKTKLVIVAMFALLIAVSCFSQWRATRQESDEKDKQILFESRARELFAASKSIVEQAADERRAIEGGRAVEVRP